MTWLKSQLGPLIFGLLCSIPLWVLYVAERSSGTNCPPPNGVVYATAYGVTANGREIADATTTSGSKTITCPNNDCNFTAADVGKIVWAQSTRTSGADVLVQDVIATVNSAQSITVTTNNASSNHTANAFLIWGTDDSAALDTAYAATGTKNCSGNFRSIHGKRYNASHGQAHEPECHRD